MRKPPGSSRRKSIDLTITTSRSKKRTVEPRGNKSFLNNEILFHHPSYLSGNCRQFTFSSPVLSSVKQTNSCSLLRCLPTMFLRFLTYNGGYFVPHFTHTTKRLLFSFIFGIQARSLHFLPDSRDHHAGNPAACAHCRHETGTVRTGEHSSEANFARFMRARFMRVRQRHSANSGRDASGRLLR